MPYYAEGDYYRGDYYGYQAGGLFGILKKVGGVVAGGVKGFLKGGPLGAASGAVSAAIGKQKTTAVAKITTPPLSMFPMPGGMQLPDVPRGTPGAVGQPGFRGMIERALPGGQSGYVPGAAVGAGAPAGYHWNKSFSYAKGLPAGSFLVRNRSMNPTNPRALRRASRRANRFVAVARQVLKQTNYKVVTKGYGAKKTARRR